MNKKMTEAELVEYLLNMNLLEAELFYERQELESQIETLEEAIERHSLTGSGNNEISHVTVSGDKVYQILEKAERSIAEEISRVTRELWEIVKKEEQLRTVKRCLMRLPYFQRELLEDLYITGIDWKDYAKRHYQSRATVFRNRKRAIQNLLEIVNRYVLVEQEKQRR